MVEEDRAQETKKEQVAPDTLASAEELMPYGDIPTEEETRS